MSNPLSTLKEALNINGAIRRKLPRSPSQKEWIANMEGSFAADRTGSTYPGSPARTSAARQAYTKAKINLNKQDEQYKRSEFIDNESSNNSFRKAKYKAQGE